MFFLWNFAREPTYLPQRPPIQGIRSTSLARSYLNTRALFRSLAIISLLLITGCAGVQGFPFTLMLVLLLIFIARCNPLTDPDRQDEFWLRYFLFQEKDPPRTCEATQDYTQNFNLSAVDPATAGFGFTMTAENTADRFGRGISSAGDFNGDGVNDFIVSAFHYVTANKNGRAYVVFGGRGQSPDLPMSSLTTATGIHITGAAAGDQLGDSRTISGVGDINGDGFDDIVVGAYKANSNDGRAYLIFGSASPMSIDLAGGLSADAGVVFEGNAGGLNQYLGSAVTGLGDVNGDGFDDLAIGGKQGTAAGYNGDVHVIYGKASAFTSPFVIPDNFTSTDGFLVQGEATNDLFGSAVSRIGDINNDGIDDLIGGTGDANTNTGAAYVIYGTSGNRSDILMSAGLSASDGYEIFSTNGAATDWGYSVSTGDFNGDGQQDVAMSSTMYDASAGKVAVIYGHTGQLDLNTLSSGQGFFLTGPGTTNPQAGEAMSLRSDINGDGFDDLVIGASRTDYNGYNNSGSVFVLFGKDGVPLTGTGMMSLTDGITGFRIDGPATNARFGISLATADINDDACADLLIGASQSNSDKAYVIYGGKAR